METSTAAAYARPHPRATGALLAYRRTRAQRWYLPSGPSLAADAVPVRLAGGMTGHARGPSATEEVPLAAKQCVCPPPLGTLFSSSSTA